MKVFTYIAAIVLPAAASAFDSEAWLAHRDAMGADADRMRSEWSNCTALVTAPAENLTIPVQLHPDGSPKIVLKSAKAQNFIQERKVWAEGVAGVVFGEDGSVAARASADSCVVDVRSRSGWAEGSVSVEYGPYSMRGGGFYFSGAEEFVKISGGVVMRAENIDFGGGSAAAILSGRRSAAGKEDGQ